MFLSCENGKGGSLTVQKLGAEEQRPAIWVGLLKALPRYLQCEHGPDVLIRMTENGVVWSKSSSKGLCLRSTLMAANSQKLSNHPEIDSRIDPDEVEIPGDLCDERHRRTSPR